MGIPGRTLRDFFVPIVGVRCILLLRRCHLKSSHGLIVGGMVFVKTGAFDEKVDFFQPKAEHFVSRAQPWSPHIDGIPQKDVN